MSRLDGVENSPSFGALWGLRVLLLGVAPATRQLLTALLVARGAIVEVADEGAAGFDKARRGTTELIVLEHTMPSATGLRLLISLRAQRIIIPTLVLTATGSEDLALEVIAHPRTGYMTTPISPDCFLAGVLSLWPRRRMQPVSLRPPLPRSDHPLYANWVRAMVAAISAPEDPRTIDEWAHCVGQAAVTLRQWHRAAEVPAKGSLDLARVLRAARLAATEKRNVRQYLRIADPRTLAKLAAATGLDHSEPTFEAILSKQRLVHNHDAVLELLELLRGT